MKYLNAVMILLFVVAAALQYDDPRPLLWIAVYGISSLLCLAFAVGMFPTILAAAFAAGCLIGSLVMFWDLLVEDPAYKSQLFEEAAGLFIVFLWISTLSWAKLRDQSTLT